ncbi:MAG: hypothetical protein PWQ84_75 [Thermotogaceae bacterium]|jgi:hypothetical protein|nr:hypothetical protein [Thermotogaceae bacterium]
MKKTLIAYTIIFTVLAILLYFLSMSWMNFLFRPNLNKEIEIILSEIPRQHPLVTENQVKEFSRNVENISDELKLFVSHFEYYEKLAPAFTNFEDTFTYLDFWEGALHSAYVFPLLFKYRDGQLIIKSSLGNIIPSGSVIKSINEESVDEIMEYFKKFIYAETEEEKGFWACERYLLNFYPEFFKANEYSVQYSYEDNQFEETVKQVPWNEFSSWKDRIESTWYELKTYEEFTVLKILDLSYSEQNIYDIRKVMNELINSNPSKLLIDLTDAKGHGENYYNLQIFLSFLTKEEGYLIPKQVTRYHEQTGVFAIIPQNNSFQGELYFLISRYSIYPYIKALISFCNRTNTGVFIGESPLSSGDYFSNPFKEPLYISYLIPKVCRTYNAFEKENFEKIISKEISFSITDYLKLLDFEKDYRNYFSLLQ